MRTLLVGYDLNRPGQDYAGLIDSLKNLGAWWHHLDSTLLIKTNLTPVQLRDRVKPFLDSGDELLVLEVTGVAWAGAGLPARAYTWLSDNL